MIGCSPSTLNDPLKSHNFPQSRQFALDIYISLCFEISLKQMNKAVETNFFDLKSMNCPRAMKFYFRFKPFQIVSKLISHESFQF